MSKKSLANKLREYTIFDDPKVLKASMKATADTLEELEGDGTMILFVIALAAIAIWSIIVW